MSEVIFCPKCPGTQECEVHMLPGKIEVDYCPSCEGSWFDAGEISQRLEFNKDLPEFKKVLSQAKETEHTCPRCQAKKLVEMKFIENSDLLIDYCTGCKGVWLDGGELAILDKLAKKDDNKKISLAKAMYMLKNKVGRAKKYTCPNCKGENLYNFESGEKVTSDFCQDCNGVWFDAGEAADTTELSTDIPDFDTVYKQKKPSGKECPKCIKSELVEFPYTPKHDLMIDYCETCKGIWLDPGELSKMEDIAPELEDMNQRILNVKRKAEKDGYIIL